jgi:hypothetical protein
MKPRIWIPALLALAAWPASAALPPQDPELEDAVAEILEEYDDAMNAFRRAYTEAAAEDKREVYDESYPDPADYIPRLWEVIELNAGDPACAEALIWIVRNDRAGDDSERAVGMLLAEHIESESLGEVCSVFARRVKDGRPFLERVMADSPHREVRASARFFLASLMLQEVEYADSLIDGDEDTQKGYREYLGEEVADRLATLDRAAATAQARAYMEQILSDDPDVEHPYKGTLGAAAEGILFEMDNLVVGKVAPDIEGNDLDGVPFKLSDYRGKVVVLDFWGNW